MKHIIKVEVLENLPSTRPLIAMDENKKFFIEGKKEPVGPADNEIWYTTSDNEIYDLGGIIKVMPTIGATYTGPGVVSNEYNEEKQIWCMTFDNGITILGDVNLDTMIADSPFFMTNQKYGLKCNVETIILPKTITRIGDYAFYECSSLTSITIPNSVTSIGGGAFAFCTSLASVDIPNSVTSIGGTAFAGCSSLTSITIPNIVSSIGSYTFAGCGRLTSINIPNSVVSIGNDAFQNCKSLTSVTIPNSVTSIGEDAFQGCVGLNSIICEATTPPTLGLTVFVDTNDCPIYVPSQSVDAYKAAENWAEYASRIVGLLNNNQIRYTRSPLLTINDNVAYTEHTFENGVGVVTFDNDITAIPLYWFTNIFVEYGEAYDGNLLTSLTLPNGISSIEMGALLYCADTVYYQGTQKECARISKDPFDGSGAGFYHCFDGIVSDKYNSNIITPFYLALAPWLRELIGDEVFFNFIITMSVKIDEHPMTAGEFITMLVNGIEGIIALSTYGFTVVNQEIQGITIPLAYHTESGHFIGIAKATDYEHGGLSEASYIAPVAVNESLDPDYMYMLLDDTITQAS